jgi:hypothetical protein
MRCAAAATAAAAGGVFACDATLPLEVGRLARRCGQRITAVDFRSGRCRTRSSIFPSPSLPVRTAWPTHAPVSRSPLLSLGLAAYARKRACAFLLACARTGRGVSELLCNGRCRLCGFQALVKQRTCGPGPPHTWWRVATRTLHGCTAVPISLPPLCKQRVTNVDVGNVQTLNTQCRMQVYR